MATPRRPLDFRTFDAILADVDTLHSRTYTQLGQWDLATICNHLAKTMEVGLDRKPIPIPLTIRLLAPLLGKWIFRRTLHTRRMPTGIRAPLPFRPDSKCDPEPAIAHLKATIARAQSFPGPLAKHPLFGQMTPDQWRDLQLIHCSHHLSFLLPKE
ncbi:MAG TPA: DUF1569 domain-containing protein [Tepidisphaeraceae bacterium]|nr:DUF1569 domain-containing protein [Tepidisphaeraceae bacterium]